MRRQAHSAGPNAHARHVQGGAFVRTSKAVAVALAGVVAGSLTGCQALGGGECGEVQNLFAEYIEKAARGEVAAREAQAQALEEGADEYAAFSAAMEAEGDITTFDVERLREEYPDCFSVRERETDVRDLPAYQRALEEAES